MIITKENEKKIEELLSQMTLEEKVNMCHACAKFYSAGVKRLGIDELALMDGPNGVRSETERNRWTCLEREEDKCTYLPTLTAVAATCNPELAYRFGETLGSEARYREKDIILGPGINIIRNPLCGRNFEYMSEDPCIIEKLSPPVVKGIESQDVAACVKHFALNNQEKNRMANNVLVSRRALFEIYLRGFYAAIIEGGASSVMGAYNKFEGQHLCHNDYLVNKILKERWGFSGVYMSDWAGCHDTDEAIKNGLDLEMGTSVDSYNKYFLADAFLEKAKESDDVRTLLDEKVRRILRLMFSVNKFDKNRKRGEFNTKEHQKTTYDIASEAMVLLKNENNILPIRKKANKILVVGKNAVTKHAEGGGSCGVRSLYEITPLDGIKRAFEPDCRIDYDSGELELKYAPIPAQNLEIAEQKAGIRGFKQTVTQKNGDGSEEQLVFYKTDTELAGTKYKNYLFEATLIAPETGNYSFMIESNVFMELSIGDKIFIKPSVEAWKIKYGHTERIESATYLEKGERVNISIKLENPIADPKLEFGYLTPSQRKNVSSGDLFRKAKEADYIIYCAGLGHNFDVEGADRLNMSLPAEQDIMIEKLASINPNIIVTLTAGSPVEMPWLDSVPGVIFSWYAGTEGGYALGDIISGAVCPSGKMPFTLPYKYSDTPVARYGEYNFDESRYLDDILVGYRGFDYDNIAPMFPFMHGLSYSEFDYSDLAIKQTENGAIVSFKITNVGAVTAKETAQLYVSDPVCSVKRAKKELRNFQKVELKPNESKEICWKVTEKDLSFIDEATEKWILEKGRFDLLIGSSSRDIRLTGSFTI